MSDDLTMVSFRAGDETQILDLFATSFRRALPRDVWNWRFQGAPAGPGVIVLAWDGARLAAHYAVTPVTLWVSGVEAGTGLSGTTMTHPEYRGGGLFPKLARATYDEMVRRQLHMVWGFPNVQSHRGFVRDLAWKDVWEIPTFRLTLPISRAVDATPDIREVDEIDASFDELWRDVRDRYQVATVRDRAWLTWRYHTNPVEKYRILANRRDGMLLGYAVLKRYKDDLHVVDLLARTDAACLALVHAAAARAQAENASSVSLWLGVHHPLHLELERMGFHNDAPITYLGARVLDRSMSSATVAEYRHWYVTMGDSDVY